MSEEYGSLWQMLDKRLEGLEEGQNAIKTDVAVIKDRQSGLINNIDKIKITVYGNGQHGLVTKMALMWQKVGIYVALVSGGITILVTLIIAFVKGK